MKTAFLYHLRDTIILLGGGTRLASLVANVDSASAADVDELRKLNLKLINATKDRLASINTIKIARGPSEAAEPKAGGAG